MTDSFTIHTNTSYRLNFMIYIQNIYLNQHENKENLRFPYIAKQLNFSTDFEDRFKNYGIYFVNKLLTTDMIYKFL